jgi:Tfp pilus assembly protein PilO
MEKGNLKQIATFREMIMAAVIMLLIIYLFFTNLYPPKKKEAESLKNQIGTLTTEQKTLTAQKAVLLRERQIKTKTRVNDEVANTKDAILKGKKPAIFDKPVDYLNHISDPSFLSNVKLLSVVTGKPADLSFFTKTSLLLKTEGSYKENINFLKGLENLEALVSIDNVILKPDNEEEPGLISLNLTTTVYQVEGVNVQK